MSSDSEAGSENKKGTTDDSVADLSIADLELVEEATQVAPAKEVTAPPPPPPPVSKAPAAPKAPPPPKPSTPPPAPPRPSAPVLRARTGTSPGAVAKASKPAVPKPRAASNPPPPVARPARKASEAGARPAPRAPTPAVGGTPAHPHLPNYEDYPSEHTQPAVNLEDLEETDPRVNDHLEDARALVHMCEKELGEGPDPIRQARLHYEMARLFEGILDDGAKAAEHYQKAARIHPDHAPTLRGARRALIRTRRFKEALQLYDAEVRITGEPRRRAALLYAKGRLLEDAVADLDEALDAFRSALELAPDDRSILKAIERCERQQESWSALSRTHEKVARVVASDKHHRAALVAERARLAEIRENDAAMAAQLYIAALETDARAPAALSSLKRLTRSRHDWRQLVNALMREHDHALTPAARATALQLVAYVLRDHLGEVPQAIEALKKAVDLEPTDRGMRHRLADLYHEAGLHEELASVLISLAESTDDRHERIALCQRIARIFEDQLDDGARARRWYEIALELDHGFQPIIQALVKVYERSGDWEALIQMLHHEADSVDDSEGKATAHARIAEILETHLKRPDDAANEHGRVLALMPNHEPAFKALSRLHAEAGQWEKLIELFGRAVDRAPDDERAIAYLFRIGLIQEDQLGDHAGACHAYGRILELEPGNLGAIHALQRAAERAGRYRDLVHALDLEAGLSNDKARQVSLKFMAAEVMDDHLDEPESAIRRLRDVLLMDRTHRPALTMIGRLFARQGRWEDLLENRKALLHITPRGSRSVDLLFEMGELCRARLGREGDAIIHYRAALQIDEEHEASYQALLRVLTSRCAWDDLATLLEQRVGTRKQPIENARLAMELGDLYEEHVRKTDKALAAYDRALSAVPGYRPALDARARLLAEKGAWKELAEELKREAVGVPDVTQSIDAKLREGEVRSTRLNDHKGAIKCYESVLEHHPGHVGALLALEDLHLRMRHRDKLADVYDLQSAALTDPGARVAALRELARIEIDDKGDAERADAAYQSILEIISDDEEALYALAARAQSGDARLALESRLASASDDPMLIAYHQTRVAELLEEQSAPEAIGAYRAALALDPESLSAVRGFTRMARNLNDPAALREAGHREAKVTRDLGLAVDLLLASAIARRRGQRAEEAVEDLEKAIELDPEHVDVARHLSDVLVNLGRVQRVIELLGRAADQAKTPERVAALHTDVARLYASHQEDVPAAIASLERALKALPSFVPALELLADCLERSQKWGDAADALRRLVRYSKSDSQRANAHLRLAAISDERLGKPEDARKALDAVIEHDPDNRSALGRLARLHAREGRRDEALELSRRLADAAVNPLERAGALIEVASIEEALGHESEAAKALHEAFTMQGPNSESAARYRRIVQQGSPYASWDDYLGALLRHLDLAARSGFPIADTYLAMAEVFGDQLNRPDRAFTTLREGIAKLPHDRSLSLALGSRLAAVSAHDKVIEEMRRLIEKDVAVPEAYRMLSGAIRALGQADEALTVLMPLQVIGGGTPEEIMSMRGRRVRAGMARPGLLGDAGFRELQVADCHDAPPAALLAAIAEGARKLYSMDLSTWGVSKRDRLRAGADDPVRVVADRVGNIFGVTDFDVYMHDLASERDVRVELGSTLALMVPQWAGQLSQSQLVFMLARPIANIARELYPIDKLDVDDLKVLLLAAGRSVSPGFGTGYAPEDELDYRSAQLSKALPRRSRQPAQDAAARFASGAPPDIVGWSHGIRQTAARAAVLLSDDIVGAIEISRRVRGVAADALDDGMIDLLQFWVSDTAARFRRATQ